MGKHLRFRSAWISLIRVYNVFRKNTRLNEQEATSVDPDQTAWMCRLICIHMVAHGILAICHGLKK
jgi:cytosine/adenosine deaminase-related metal-dependent hydrolase